MKSILVALDLKGRSEAAVRRAKEIAADTGASVTYLHVGIAEDAEAQALAKAQNIEITVLPGEPSEIVSFLAHNESADLLVLGAHQARFVQDITTATLLGKLLETCECPILVIASDAELPYTRSAAGIALPDHSVKLVEACRAVAAQSSLVLVHAFHQVMGDKYTQLESAEQRDQIAAVEALVAAQGWTDVEVVVREGGPARLLQHVVNENGIDLLALGVPSHRGLAKRILGSTTLDILANPPCDVLIAP